MPKFIWRTKDRFGNPVAREVPANSAQESKEILLAEGCRELTLVQDEVGAAAVSATGSRINADERVKYRSRPRATLFRVAWRGLWRSRRLVLIILLVAAYAIYAGDKYVMALSGIGLAAWLSFLVFNGLPSIYFGRLHRAADWHRWPEVLKIVATLRRINGFNNGRVPETSLVRFRAQALAGLGRLPEALQEYGQCENQPGCPSWLYKGLVAGIYDKAKQHDAAIEWNLKAVQEKPISTAYLDLANRYLRYKRDSARARTALAEAEKTPMTENGVPFYKRCLGIAAYLEGNLPVARQELEESLSMMESTPNVPFRAGGISIAKGYLSCVLARQGDLAEARKRLTEARGYLVATRDDELLAECEKLVGGGAR